MDIKKIFGAINSLIPFWSNNVVSYFGVGSEYAMTINIILAQIFSSMESNFTEQIMSGFLIIISLTLIFYKLGYNICDIICKKLIQLQFMVMKILKICQIHHIL